MSVGPFAGQKLTVMTHRPTGAIVRVASFPCEAYTALRRRTLLLLRLTVKRAKQYGPPRLVRDYTEASGDVFDGAIPREVQP